MMKKLLTIATLAALSGTAMAADGNSAYGLTVSGSAALTTDYRFRGWSQTQNDPALQGAVTIAHDSGVYFSGFASNVNFGTADPSLELDPALGYSKDLGFGLLDVGAVYYNYPSASDLNWLEFYGKLTFSDVAAKGDSLMTNLNYTSEYLGSDEDGWNINAAYSIPFGESGFGGVAALGYTKSDYGFGKDKDDYVDWKVGINYASKSISGLTAELAAVGSNIDFEDEVGKRGVETGAVFTVTKAF